MNLLQIKDLIASDEYEFLRSNEHLGDKVIMIDAKGVCISAGSACHSHRSEPSRVLTAMGLSDDEARDSVRISFSSTNTPAEIEEAAAIFSSCIKTLAGLQR